LIDNELSEEVEKVLEKYNGSHEDAAANFEWLKKTKLPEENIEFPAKNSLYRTEKKPATIISIQWFRYGAAAAVLVLAGLLWLSNDEEKTAVGIDHQGTSKDSQKQRK
jgi:hypothetical protein